jgi:hypothetical protein
MCARGQARPRARGGTQVDFFSWVGEPATRQTTSSDASCAGVAPACRPPLSLVRSAGLADPTTAGTNERRCVSAPNKTDGRQRSYAPRPRTSRCGEHICIRLPRPRNSPYVASRSNRRLCLRVDPTMPADIGHAPGSDDMRRSFGAMIRLAHCREEQHPLSGAFVGSPCRLPGNRDPGAYGSFLSANGQSAPMSLAHD